MVADLLYFLCLITYADRLTASDEEALSEKTGLNEIVAVVKKKGRALKAIPKVAGYSQISTITPIFT